MTIQVSLGEDRSYAIHVVDTGYAELGSLVRAATGATRAFVVTNPVVGPLYADSVSHGLQAGSVKTEVLEVPDGEEYKNLATWQDLVEALLGRGIDRKSVVVALGGGVVGDLSGFAAASVLRGVAFVQVPTTLLAMVDSAVGGKTGVNARNGKNLVGAFYQPRLVYAALHTLETLPLPELRSGLGEVVKHGVLRDASLVDLLVRESAAVLALRPDVIRALVERCCEIKADIVGQDERETGLRSLLNFGHTVGHALETATGLGSLRHGECVAIGLLAETRWAIERGSCDPAAAARIREVFRKLGLVAQAPEVDRQALDEAAGIDKKIAYGMLDTAILERVGWARHEKVPTTEIVRMLDLVLEEEE